MISVRYFYLETHVQTLASLTTELLCCQGPYFPSQTAKSINTLQYDTIKKNANCLKIKLLLHTLGIFSFKEKKIWEVTAVLEIPGHTVTALSDSDRQCHHFSKASPSFPAWWEASACVPLECAHVSILALTNLSVFFLFLFLLFLCLHDEHTVWSEALDDLWDSVRLSLKFLIKLYLFSSCLNSHKILDPFL